MKPLRICAAPLQGYTEAEWRIAHRAIYGNGIDTYHSPFVRIEHGSPRQRDLRDALATPTDVPQIIAADADELDILTNALAQTGHRRIDINMGCPFVPQLKRGRGAALIAFPDRLESMARRMEQYPEVTFSVKMRLGIDNPDQWQQAMPVINSMKLAHVTVHPRTARQQYSGQLHTEIFAAIAYQCQHPLFFNGEIHTPDDIDRISQLFPTIAGVMIGRGLLQRPSLVAEWTEGKIWSPAQRMDALKRFHTLVMDSYASRLCGNHQLLDKIKPFWDYLESETGHKAAKAIRKCRNLDHYLELVRSI